MASFKLKRMLKKSPSVKHQTESLIGKLNVQLMIWFCQTECEVVCGDDAFKSGLTKSNHELESAGLTTVSSIDRHLYPFISAEAGERLKKEQKIANASSPQLEIIQQPAELRHALLIKDSSPLQDVADVNKMKLLSSSLPKFSKLDDRISMPSLAVNMVVASPRQAASANNSDTKV